MQHTQGRAKGTSKAVLVGGLPVLLYILGESGRMFKENSEDNIIIFKSTGALKLIFIDSIMCPFWRSRHLLSFGRTRNFVDEYRKFPHLHAYHELIVIWTNSIVRRQKGNFRRDIQVRKLLGDGKGK